MATVRLLQNEQTSIMAVGDGWSSRCWKRTANIVRDDNTTTGSAQQQRGISRRRKLRRLLHFAPMCTAYMQRLNTIDTTPLLIQVLTHGPYLDSKCLTPPFHTHEHSYLPAPAVSTPEGVLGPHEMQARRQKTSTHAHVCGMYVDIYPYILHNGPCQDHSESSFSVRVSDIGTC